MILSIKNLSLTFGGNTILNGVGFDVKHGEIVSIIGPSGCGKSTILKSIVGVCKPHSGVINLDGTNIINMPINKRGVVMVFQDFSLFPHMTIEQNMMVGSRDEVLNESIVKYLGLHHLCKKFPHQMSGGEQQRATVARAIANKPKLLLLDEPFSSVDSITTKIFRERVYDLIVEHQITTIMVTHDLNDVFEMSDRCVVMDTANVVQFDTLEKIYYKPKNNFVASLFGTVFDYDGKTYRPEEIEVYEKPIESSIEATVINTKFKLLYNELLVRFGDSMEPYVVHDCHRRDVEPDDTVFITMKKNKKAGG